MPYILLPLTHTKWHASQDVGQNTYEVWCLENGGGGWFHNIHVHLVGMVPILRDGGFPLQPYERLLHDVVQLHPGNEAYVIARFGPHVGECSCSLHRTPGTLLTSD